MNRKEEIIPFYKSVWYLIPLWSKVSNGWWWCSIVVGIDSDMKNKLDCKVHKPPWAGQMLNSTQNINRQLYKLSLLHSTFPMKHYFKFTQRDKFFKFPLKKMWQYIYCLIYFRKCNHHLFSTFKAEKMVKNGLLKRLKVVLVHVQNLKLVISNYIN